MGDLLLVVCLSLPLCPHGIEQIICHSVIYFHVQQQVLSAHLVGLNQD